MAVSILNGAIQVNEFRNNANLNQGKAVANAWSFWSKANTSVGPVPGNLNLITSGANIIIDNDLFDMNVPNAGGQSPVTGGNAEVI
ncbi:hypothetical protein L7E55_06375 [Pelotomaculum isophthalicicum JI]|uniref:Uncharacterized protein n=1 Tax=Pelotomaculum isophthalicicum JI TaxID=947010 RepID=A0A9X4GYP1_9FIRM|nr:hypothetical protein [Pelotomaculum isophthalicicum]MDF9407987.1 hypothetical protein [Pelotomaculum isophthalicicum JI]